MYSGYQLMKSFTAFLVSEAEHLHEFHGSSFIEQSVQDHSSSLYCIRKRPLQQPLLPSQLDQLQNPWIRLLHTPSPHPLCHSASQNFSLHCLVSVFQAWKYNYKSKRLRATHFRVYIKTYSLYQYCQIHIQSGIRSSSSQYIGSISKSTSNKTASIGKKWGFSQSQFILEAHGTLNATAPSSVPKRVHLHEIV